MLGRLLHQPGRASVPRHPAAQHLLRMCIARARVYGKMSMHTATICHILMMVQMCAIKSQLSLLCNMQQPISAGVLALSARTWQHRLLYSCAYAAAQESALEFTRTTRRSRHGSASSLARARPAHGRIARNRISRSRLASPATHHARACSLAAAHARRDQGPRHSSK